VWLLVVATHVLQNPTLVRVKVKLLRVNPVLEKLNPAPKNSLF
jgi:hypothetical protein